MTDLPITSRLDDIRQGLRFGAALVLEAPPGAGKTTLVPLALLDEPWLEGGKILVLEPRRLAAKAAARRMAALLGESVGHRVGYRVRKDRQVSAATRIEVITEGILTRMLIDDPALPGVNCVIFDEFHERSLQADVGLGLTRLTQQLARPELRIVVMSATLASLDLERLLPDAVTVVSHGRTFPITDTWLRSRDQRPLQALVAAAVRDALQANPGDVLVFLPGLAEIRRCEEALRGIEAEVLPLHGDLPPDAQDKVLSARRQGALPRVILSTSVAESSVTIDGVSTVVDAGLAREPRFDPRSGLTRLVTVPVSKDSAEQRRGRAGRTGPGHCIRLWTEAEHRDLPERRTPEILSADLAPLVVELAAYGADASDVLWLDAPPRAALEQAQELLVELEVLDHARHLTPHGRRVAAHGTHPRLAHMILRAEERGLGDVARRLADLIDDQQRPRGSSAEIHLPGVASEAVGHCLALAYPDRVARRKDPGRYLLRNGRTARVSDHDPLDRYEWIAIADLGGGGDPRIGWAAPLTEDAVRTEFADQITINVTAGWDERTQQMMATEDERLGALTLSTRPARSLDPQAQALAFARALEARGYRDLPWTRATEQLRDRILFVRHHAGERTSMPLAPESLAPFLIGMRKLTDLKGLNMGTVLEAVLTWNERQHLERLAPTLWTTPQGREIRIDYADPERPSVSVRLQQAFGLSTTPTVANGAIPLTMILLSPADRPIQITQDLAGFWSGSYADVRKEMRGRYPKHAWPENPTDRLP